MTSVGAFAVIAIRERETGEPATLESLRGWGFSRPILGAALAIFLLSLGGFPPTAGFLAKFYLFAAAVDADYTYLAIVGVVSTVISLGYYLRIGLALYDRAREPGADDRAAARHAWARRLRRAGRRGDRVARHLPARRARLGRRSRLDAARRA